MHSKGNHKQKTTHRIEQIFANEVTDGINFQTIKLTHKLSSKKTKHPNQKMDRRARYFSKDDIQMANKHMKKCSTSLVNYQRNANQNFNEVSPHSGQNGYHQESINNKCWRGCGEK